MYMRRKCMYVYKDLQSLLDVSVNWEKELKDLYDVAQLGIKHKKSKELIEFLLAKQTRILSVLVNLDVHKYGGDEFIKFTPENHTEKLIPQQELTGLSKPDEIIKMIKMYESQLKNYYKEIADHLLSENQRELFQSLVTLKEVQLEALDNFIREHINQVV